MTTAFSQKKRLFTMKSMFNGLCAFLLLLGGLTSLPGHLQAQTDPASISFIQTLNNLRQKRGLPAMRLDPQITQSAQWLADHMARFDVLDHDAVKIGGKAFSDMRGIEERLKHFKFPDMGAAEACASG